MMRPFVAAVISCAVAFLIGEFAASRIVNMYGDALDITRGVLQTDAHMGWRQRAGLDTTFLNLPLQTNERGWRAEPVAHAMSAEKRILILGPSSAFGWGVRAEDTYAVQLQKKLAPADVAVINAGEIGYSSMQGARMYESGFADIRPDVVVVAYGINDLDRNRFYYQSNSTDAQEFRVPKPASRVVSVLQKSSLAILIMKAGDRVRRTLSKPVGIEPPGDPVPTVRVPVDEFVQNISAIVNRATLQGAKVILLTTAVHLPTERSEESIEAEKILQSAVLHWTQGKKEEAERLLNMSVTKDADQSDAYYYLASIAQSKGDTRNATRYRDTATKNEPYRVARTVASYNEAMRRVASEHNVPLGDIDKWFGATSRDALFVDPIHFSPAGNEVVADGLQTIISENSLLD